MLSQIRWKRLWILQETAVAKKVEVGFGAHILSWPDLMALINGVQLTTPSNAALPEVDAHTINPSAMERRILAAAERLQAIDELCKSMFSRRGNLTGLSLHKLLQLSTGTSVTMPVDRIYALLGLMSPNAVPLTPDYQTPPTVVYLETLVYIINSDHLLDVLVDCWPPLAKACTSWSKDFAQPWEPRGSFATLGYTAGSRLRPQCKLMRGDTTPGVPALVETTIAEWYGVISRMPLQLQLHVQGLRVDSIARVYSRTSLPMAASPHQSLHGRDPIQLKKMLMSSVVAMMTRCETAAFPPKDPRSALMGLILSRTDSTQASNHLGPEALFALWWRSVYEATDADTPEMIIDSAARRLTDEQALSIGNIVAERVLVGTTQGLIGLAPQGIQQGDLIVVAFGASTPFVLRQTRGAFTLVGDAFVHGVMHGEMLQLHEEDPAAMEAETFVLV